MNQKDPYNQSPWRAAFLVSALGFDIIVCTFVGYWLGNFAGKQFGDVKSWTVGGVLFGFAIGIATVVLVLKKFLEDKQE
ncbi:AtpZ/AtpI family protein [Paenibacillus eucommiae]|uniref:F0F1-type ATP synthase assembly protein I n=1 Tax=Paenibacillus eucommiae TaxID=1355755 RepID=A0ABS4IYB9_9BACL|nr:AtpZ/AtpI family protein [Paenibacillus eucommiae]MBP1992585.1 F0F1-type ATP synthase assembly protein I [Paenibacillus eucommiae]